MRGMRSLLTALALCIGLTAAAPAHASEAPKAPPKAAPKKAPAKKAPPRTLAFDGHYIGRLRPQGGAKGCGLHQVNDFVIDKGTIVPADAAASLTPVFDGFVTNDGFITGHMRLIDTVAPFEGRAEKKGVVTLISGGVIDDTSHCVWVLDLTIQ